MRVAVVDIGTNSTRLLIADVGADGTVTEVQREATVTRLGDGLEATGRLGEAAQARVHGTLERYAAAIRRHGCAARTAVLTSAVRDADNGAAFAAEVRERHGLAARTLSGEEEARATYRGASAARDPCDPARLLVIDIGGGSTELVTGDGFRVSLQLGVVRHTERHLRTDPPARDQLAALADDARAQLRANVPAAVARRQDEAIAVAGTPTSCAAIELELDPYDPTRVEGYTLRRATLRSQVERLAAMPNAERRTVTGLHPDRAPTIVAGVLILIEVLDAFGLDAVTASERDILWGIALDTAHP